MSRETPPPNTSAEVDQATDFARAVVSKQLAAGPDVRRAARRHLRDLRQGHKRGLHWDLSAARFAIGFFEDVLVLNGGEFEGKPFLLAPWQAFIVGSLFGWKRADGYRRFRTAFIETAKGSGKSPLAAGIGLLGLVADKEARAEIYAAATKRDQAMILFRDAVAMVKQSPALSARVETSGRNEKVWNLFYASTDSFFKPISADEGQSGPRPHVALLDEIHEHRNANVVNMVRAGTKSRRQALIVMITNSGSDKNSVCWAHHELGVRVCKGEVENDAFFAFICSLDKGDDPFKDESCWVKVNPSLDFILEGQSDGIPGRQYLREQVDDARGMPSKEAMTRRLNFCEWTQATSPWISWDIWEQAQQPVPMALLRNRPCVGGLDLSSTTDLTSFVLLFYPTYEDPHWRLLPYFWIPDNQLDERERRDKVPYSVWIKSRDLETTPGRAISKLHVLRRMQSICAYFDVRKIGYDRWRIEDLVQLMGEHDISLPPLVKFGQDYKSMAPAVDEFERRLLGVDMPAMLVTDDDPAERPAVESLRHDGNPVMTWCAGNAVTTTDGTNRKVDKAKAIGRVDGIVAALIATGVSGSAATLPSGTSIYDEGVGI